MGDRVRRLDYFILLQKVIERTNFNATLTWDLPSLLLPVLHPLSTWP